MSRHPPKRPRLGPSTYHDRIPLENDFEVLHARTSALTGPGRFPTDTARSPLKGRTTWTIGDTWAPEDDPEFSLDPDGECFDEEMDADIGDIINAVDSQAGTATRPQRSKASVSIPLLLPHILFI